jgi:glycosyltransferase involved in cell wall biosynthesis
LKKICLSFIETEFFLYYSHLGKINKHIHLSEVPICGLKNNLAKSYILGLEVSNMIHKILHLTNTDVITDSRILKEVSVLSETGSYSVNGVGITENHGRSKIIKKNNAELRVLNTVSHKFTLLPRSIRYVLVLLELTVRFSVIGLFMRPKIIHCHDTMVILPGLIIKLLTGAKLIYDAHELESNKNGQNWILSKATLFLERICWNKVDHLITVSPSIIDWYRQNLGDKPSTLILNSPTMSKDNIVKNDTARKENYFHEKYQIPPEKFVFLYIGGLVEGRGIDLMVDVFKKSNFKSHLVFLGYGKLSHDLKMLSKIYMNIHVHDTVAHDKVVEIAKSADVGLCLIQNVSLSDYYCLPNKLFEYCFAGIPVIASNFPDISKVVNQYKLGLSVDLNIEDIAECIKQFESDELDVNFSASDLSELSWEAQALKLKKLYENVLSS